MHKILVVEDSGVLGPLLCKELGKSGKLSPVLVRSFAACKELLDRAQPGEFTAAALDLNLPDAPQGEVVDLAIGKGILPVVFTDEISPELRKTIWSRQIVDYFNMDSPHALNRLVQTIHRLVRNIGLKVLVVDDSGTVRNFVSRLLQAHGYTVLTAKDGPSGLATYQEDKDIRLVILDYTMPGQNGAEVAIAMRNVEGRRRRDDLALIGLSALNNPETSIEFLKSGANDFIAKPFQIEEFYCRVSQNVDMLNLFNDLRDMSNRDFLTGLFNRKRLFGAAKQYFSPQGKDQVELIAAILDIDFFKKVNDYHGHDAGDAVLKHFSQHLQEHFGKDNLVARYGGEEFCVLLVNCPPDQALEKFETFRRSIESSPVTHRGTSISITISTGVSTKRCDTFEDLLKAADELLYKAKESGRNRLCME